MRDLAPTDSREPSRFAISTRMAAIHTTDSENAPRRLRMDRMDVCDDLTGEHDETQAEPSSSIPDQPFCDAMLSIKRHHPFKRFERIRAIETQTLR